jgi:hypothetical protein
MVNSLSFFDKLSNRTFWFVAARSSILLGPLLKGCGYSLAYLFKLYAETKVFENAIRNFKFLTAIPVFIFLIISTIY